VRTTHALRVLLSAFVLLMFGACASLPQKDPLQVTVAGIEPLQGEGMELRMMVKLRVQNPNDETIEYNGASVQVDVLNKTFATGVSDESGTVPRFGEAIVKVPVTVSVLRMVRQVLGVMDGKPVEKISYEMTGKLSGPGYKSYRFETEGDFEIPKSQAELVDPATL
jgi:LEA14-like dessication related protein